MAETSILIKNQTGGQPVALRTAVEPDIDDNERFVQLMDFAARRSSFSVLQSVEGAEESTLIIRGDHSKIVVSVKTPVAFTDVFLQIQHRGMIAGNEVITAVQQLHFLPADVSENTGEASYLFSSPHIVDLAGASSIVLRVWGTGFDTDSTLAVYYGLI